MFLYTSFVDSKRARQVSLLSKYIGWLGFIQPFRCVESSILSCKFWGLYWHIDFLRLHQCFHRWSFLFFVQIGYLENLLFLYHSPLIILPLTGPHRSMVLLWSGISSISKVNRIFSQHSFMDHCLALIFLLIFIKLSHLVELSA